LEKSGTYFGNFSFINVYLHPSFLQHNDNVKLGENIKTTSFSSLLSFWIFKKEISGHFVCHPTIILVFPSNVSDVEKFCSPVKKCTMN